MNIIKATTDWDKMLIYPRQLSKRKVKELAVVVAFHIILNGQHKYELGINAFLGTLKLKLKGIYKLTTNRTPAQMNSSAA